MHCCRNCHLPVESERCDCLEGAQMLLGLTSELKLLKFRPAGRGSSSMVPSAFGGKNAEFIRKYFSTVREPEVPGSSDEVADSNEKE